MTPNFPIDPGFAPPRLPGPQMPPTDPGFTAPPGLGPNYPIDPGFSPPSLSTAPTTAQPHDREYWTRVIHSAALIEPNDPRYDASRVVVGQALLGLQELSDSAAAKDRRDISPGKIGTALVNFGHGASLGLAGDRTYLQLAREANPKTAFVSDLAGTVALGAAASPLVAGLTPAKAGIALGGALGGGRGIVEGATNPLPGMSPLESSLLVGGIGAITGGATGGLAGKFGGAGASMAKTIWGNITAKFTTSFTPTVRSIWNAVTQTLGRKASEQEVANATEAAIRAQLGKLKVNPEAIEQMITTYKGNGTLTTRGPLPPPETPIAVRPGETLTTPPAPEPPTGGGRPNLRLVPRGPVPEPPTPPTGGGPTKNQLSVLRDLGLTP